MIASVHLHVGHVGRIKSQSQGLVLHRHFFALCRDETVSHGVIVNTELHAVTTLERERGYITFVLYHLLLQREEWADGFFNT